MALFDPRIGPGSILGGIGGAYIGGYIASKAIGRPGCACDAFAPAMALGNVYGSKITSQHGAPVGDEFPPCEENGWLAASRAR